MRIRSTKPEFWRSKTIAQLSWDVRLVLKGLESYVDDNGVGKDDIALIAADVFPRDLSSNPRETLARLSEAISQLSEAGLIARYVAGGVADEEELVYVDKWKDIQRIDKPGKGRFPRPDGTTEYSEDVDRDSYRNPREIVARPPETLAPGTGEQGNRGTDKKTPSPQAARTPQSPSRFEEFWSLYPRKVGRSDAVKAFTKASKTFGDDKIIEGTRRYAADPNLPDKQFIPHPATWLNGGRWDDEPLPGRNGAQYRDERSGLLVER